MNIDLVSSENQEDEMVNFTVTSSDVPEEMKKDSANDDNYDSENETNDQSEENKNENVDSNDKSTAERNSDSQEFSSEEGKNDSSTKNNEVIDDLEVVRQRAKLNRERELEQQELESLRGKVAEIEKEKNRPLEPIEPLEKDFEDYGKYLDALDQYEEDLETYNNYGKVEPEVNQEIPQENIPFTTNQQVALDVIRHAISTDKNKPKDFELVTSNDDLPISRPMLEVIAECSNINKILYELGKNPQDCKKISQMHPAKMAVEISKLDHKFSKPSPTKPIKTSNSPDPISPVGSSASTQKPIEKMSYTEYERFMNEKEKNKPTF